MNQACRLLGISKKTYYYGRNPDETIERRYGWLKTKIERIIKENPAYGYRRIKKALFDDYGEVINHKVLLKVLRAWGLQLKRRIRPPRKSWMARIFSCSRSGEPGDNAVNEAFFSRVKEEWRDVFNEARDFKELESMIRKAMDYYNMRRYHSSIGMVQPLKFTKEQVRHLTINRLQVVS